MATVTNTYARAFADVVFSQHLDPASVLREAQSLVALITENRELRQVWETPSILAVQKRAVLDAIAGREQISPPVRNFMAVLIDHRRVEFLGPIVKQFELELNQRLGFAEAEIVSARELGPAERLGLEGELEKLTGKKIRANYSQDPESSRRSHCPHGQHDLRWLGRGKLERIQEALSS